MADREGESRNRNPGIELVPSDVLPPDVPLPGWPDPYYAANAMSLPDRVRELEARVTRLEENQDG
jgi:hypothetical protein